MRASYSWLKLIAFECDDKSTIQLVGSFRVAQWLGSRHHDSGANATITELDHDICMNALDISDNV